MATAARKLTFAEFQSLYSKSDRRYEYWFGDAILKGVPTWIHGLLQKIIMALLDETGFVAGAEIELRIDPQAHPRPDVIATRGKVEIPYPTKAVDVVVEILSEDDKMPYVRSKCRAFQEWGFSQVYVVDPSDRSVLEWVDGSLLLRDNMASIPVDRIWSALDRELGR